MFRPGEVVKMSIPYDYEPPPKSFKPRKYPPISPEMHEKIKRLYQNRKIGSGEIGEFGKRHGLPRWKITRYAIIKGWIEKQKKAVPWTDNEINILKRNAMHCPETIQRKLRKRGYFRTLASIELKRKRLKLPANLDGQSANSLAMCLGEDIHFVLAAIRSGKLRAMRREGNRKYDMWLISDKDARDFIVKNVNMIDLKKVDKYWIVDLLATQERFLK
jgi:hypothetical protein